MGGSLSLSKGGSPEPVEGNTVDTLSIVDTHHPSRDRALHNSLVAVPVHKSLCWLVSSTRVPEDAGMAWMYLLRCANGAFYTGSTAQDIEARVWQHNEGLGANFTRKHRPVELVFCEQWDRVDDAYAREKQVQGWSRRKKQALIDGKFEMLPALSRGEVRSRDDERG